MSFTQRKKQAKPSTTFTPKSYQMACMIRGVESPCAGFFLAPGLGKTMISLQIFLTLKQLGLVDELLVLATRKICYNVWPAEIKKWNLPLRASVVHGAKKREALFGRSDVKLLNYEGLPWLVKQSGWPRTLGKKRVMLVVDESSKLKHTRTVRFKMLKKLLPKFVRRYILTGSPATTGLMNLFGQIYILDEGKTLGRFITHYRNTYFYPSGYGGYEWKLQKGADKRIFKKLRPLVLRFGEDELDMPPLSIIDRYVDLPPEAREVYDEMERDMLIRLDRGEIRAANAAVASGKLRQLANGGIYLDELEGAAKHNRNDRRYVKVHDEKCEELVDLIEELQGEPALVGYEFDHDRARIQRYFDKHGIKDAVFITRKTKEHEVRRILRRWDRGEIPVLLGQTGSLAHGLNLQGKGGIVIFFGLTWSLENYEQFIRRVWRQGQKRRVLVYRIRARKTVDSDQCATLKRRDAEQQDLLKAMQRRSHGIQAVDKQRTPTIRGAWKAT